MRATSGTVFAPDLLVGGARQHRGGLERGAA